MEKIYLSLVNELEDNNKFQKYRPYLFSVLGLIYIISATLKLNSGSNSVSTIFTILYLVTGIVFLFNGFFFKSFQKKYFLEINNEEIKCQKSFFSKLKVWNLSELSSVTIKPISLILNFDKEAKTEISLGNVSYKTVVAFKEELIFFCKEKNIPIK